MKCQVKRCRQDSVLLFYDFEVCDNHWNKHCNKEIDLKKEFNIISQSQEQFAQSIFKVKYQSLTRKGKNKIDELILLTEGKDERRKS